MAWKETERAAAATIKRLYRCSDCRTEIRQEVTDPATPAPDCPTCAMAVEWQAPKPALGTNKGRAVDYAQRMAEEDYGMTNMRDNVQVGETAAMDAPPLNTVEREKIIKEAVEAGAALEQAIQLAPDQAAMAANFFTNQPLGGVAGGSAMELAKSTKSDPGSTDAVGLLEKGRDQGRMRMRVHVAASDEGRKSHVI